eukprot:1146161-Pelagomonas_calceolata.AAC.4
MKLARSLLIDHSPLARSQLSATTRMPAVVAADRIVPSLKSAVVYTLSVREHLLFAVKQAQNCSKDEAKLCSVWLLASIFAGLAH